MRSVTWSARARYWPSGLAWALPLGGEEFLTDEHAITTTERSSDAQGEVSLRARLDRRWRQFGTGFCFFVFGAAAWLGGMTLVPLIMLWPSSKAGRERRIRHLVSWAFRWLLALIAGLGVGRVKIEGRQWLAQAQGKLLLANHPMYLDVLALIGLLPDAACVVKHALWKHRWYGHFVRATGYISNATDAGVVDDCVAALRHGRSLILFPEGTRSPPGQALHFTRGAARVAVRSGCDILPIVIRCQPLGLGKGQAWHEVPERAWRLRITICPPLTLTDLDWHPDLPNGVAARHVNRALETYFAKHLADKTSAAEDA